MTGSAYEFHQTEIIQVAACQYGETLTDEQASAMDWDTKMNYLKNKSSYYSRTILLFKRLWGRVVLIRIHPIGQILNVDDWRSSKIRTEHMYSPIHLVDVLKIDKNASSKVVVVQSLFN